MAIDIKVDGIQLGNKTIRENNTIKPSAKEKADTATPAQHEEQLGNVSKHVGDLNKLLASDSTAISRHQRVAEIKAKIDNNAYHVDLEKLADKLTTLILSK